MSVISKTKPNNFVKPITVHVIVEQNAKCHAPTYVTSSAPCTRKRPRTIATPENIQSDLKRFVQVPAQTDHSIQAGDKSYGYPASKGYRFQVNEQINAALDRYNLRPAAMLRQYQD